MTGRSSMTRRAVLVGASRLSAVLFVGQMARTGTVLAADGRISSMTATWRAVAEAAASRNSRIDATAAAEARFVAWYQGIDPASQVAVEATLSRVSTIGTSPTGVAFADRPIEQRVALLADWTNPAARHEAEVVQAASAALRYVVVADPGTSNGHLGRELVPVP
jgi:hypothetical protein